MLTPKIFTHTPKFNPEPVIFFGVIFRRFGGGFFNHHKKGGWDAREHRAASGQRLTMTAMFQRISRRFQALPVIQIATRQGESWGRALGEC